MVLETPILGIAAEAPLKHPLPAAHAGACQPILCIAAEAPLKHRDLLAVVPLLLGQSSASLPRLR